jgi:16S rRNA G966 N2-methylase RsmD
MAWPEDYINKIVRGDSLEALKSMPEKSIDLIATDPPYGLGFAGEKWDQDLPSEDIWRECFRVLKPGAFAFVITTPRQDCLAELISRMGRAGFDVQFPSIYWTYLCLSADTEVLTKDGWMDRERLNKTNTSTNILVYEPETGDYRWEVPEKWSCYYHRDTAYRIKSDFTDQLVTRGHRCLIERQGELLLEFAERLSKQEKFPVLVSLHDLPECIVSAISQQGAEEFCMLQRVPSEVDIEKQYWEMGHIGEKVNKKSLPILRRGVLYLSGLVEKAKGKIWDILLGQLSLEGEYEKVCTPEDASKWFVEMDGGKKEKLVQEDNGCGKSMLEGRDNLLQNARKLSCGEVCAVSSGIYGDGPQGRLCNGASPNSSSADREAIKAKRSGTSFGSQFRKQFDGELDFICEQPGSQTSRRRKGYRTTLANVIPEYYDGIIYCPTVSTGCFVARRNGKIFLTGNSGFPKSLDVSLAIDLRLGAERPVAGEVAQPGGQMRELSRGGRGREKGTAWTGIRYDDKPITPQAEAFAGWRSPGLKPAVEVIVVAARPMSEKDYASQAIRSLEDGSEGSGCFNIGACRIPYRSREEFEEIHDGACRFRSGSRGFFGYGEKGKGEWRPVDPAGRYPANMLVSDKALDDGVQRKAGGSRSPGRAGRGAFLAGREHQSFGDEGSAGRLFDLDLWWEKMAESLPDRTKRTFPFLLEPKPSSAERDSGCEGLYWERDGTEFGYKLVGKERWEELGREEERISAETEAPCSLRARGNIHITVKPVNLFCYLITLASREGQLILDPFAGSGTTGVAAKILNRRYVLVDIYEGNCEIARRRVRDAGLPLFDTREDAP